MSAAGLVTSGDARHTAGRAIRTARALGGMVGKRRHLLLMNLEPRGRWLDRLMGGAESPGLVAVLDGRRRLADVAIPGRGRGFIYVPAGPESPPARRLLTSASLESLLQRIRERDGLALLYLADPSLAALARERGLTDVTWTLDGSGPHPPTASPHAAARVPFPVAPARERGGWTRKSRSGSPGWVRTLCVVLLLLVGALIAWVGADYLADAESIDRLLQSLRNGSESSP